MYTLAVLLVLNTVICAVIGKISYSAVTKTEDSYLEQTVDSGRKQIEQYIDKYIAVAEMLASDRMVSRMAAEASEDVPMHETASFGEGMAAIADCKSGHSAVMGIVVGSSAQNRQYRADGTLMEDVVMSERAWYQGIQGNETSVTEPYVDLTTNQLCISVCVPIRQNGGMVGGLCVDLGLDQLSEYIAEMAFGESGRLMLLSKDQTVIAYGDTGKVGMNLSEFDLKGGLIDEVASPTGRIVEYSLAGEKRISMVHSLEEYGWAILVTMPRSDYYKESTRLVLTLIFIMLAVTIVVALLLWRYISRKLSPVSEIREGLVRISEGDLDVSMDYKSDDEIGDIAQAMNESARTLSAYVGEVARAMKLLEDGDLDIQPQIGFKGDFAPIQDSILGFVGRLTEVITDIARSAGSVQAGAEQISSGAQTLAQGATEQASSIEELAATIADISEHIRSNTALANESSENAVEVNTTIVESGQKMHETMEFMNEISECSREVSKIIKTIEDIAFQTNILSLNAAVEAARAGSAGKGFAVVADEVRNLADKSAEASKSTTQLIERTLQAVENGSGSMSTTVDYMDNAVKQAAGLTEAFQKISAASAEQAEKVAQVTVGTDQISSVVQTNSATAEESAAASEELSARAQTLNQLVAQFKLKDDEDIY